MAKRKKSTPEEEMLAIINQKPASTPEELENQMILLANIRARQQILDGTASSQVLTHYIKAGSTRNRIEQDKLIPEGQLAKAKIASLTDSKEAKARFEEVIQAMDKYTGSMGD